MLNNLPILRSLSSALTVAIAALCLGTSTFDARAHGPDDAALTAPIAAATGAPVETFSGVVERVTVEDRVAAMSIDYYGLRLDNGKTLALKGPLVGQLIDGARIQATGQRNGSALFASGLMTLAGPAVTPGVAAPGPADVTGTLRLLHADYFDAGTGEFMFDVGTDAGSSVLLDLAVMPEALARGMRVQVTGTWGSNSQTLRPSKVTILALAPVDATRKAGDVEKSTTTNNVLVIMMRYLDSPANPFTLAQIQSVFAGGPGSGSVTEYYKEVSYGQQLLNPTFTNWLQSNVNTPANCNFDQFMTDGSNLATAAGYNVNNYQNLVFLFPRVSACGWAGLAYIGWGRAFINGYNSTSVYGHELGHNFGLLHAASLTCPTSNIVGGACTASEYGDPFDIMGNQSAMHFNAMQKNYLGWIPDSSVLTQSAGSGTYVLSPLENGGASKYAVNVPTRKNRTFWMEFRQPIGFDSGLSSRPNNGTQVRVASPLEWVCGGCGDDTELLDMAPGTSAFTDATLVMGKNFRDPTTGVSISVIGFTPTAMSLFVQMGGQPIVADFNGDGKADLLWRNPTTGETLMWLMNGNTIIGGGSIMTSTAWEVTHTGDFNGDGRSDLIWRNAVTGETAMWMMNGAAFAGGGSLMTDPAWVVTHVADFNGDGKSDLLWRNMSTGETVIWLMDGYNIIGSASLMTDPTWVATYVGDFNGDHKADIVWRNTTTGQTAIWLMNGGSLLSGGAIMSDPNWTVTHVADFNGDGKSDLVWRNTQTGATALWLMNGLSFVGGIGLMTDPNWQVTHVADLNGDGRADLIWRNFATGQTAAWLMSGTTLLSGGALLSDGNYSVTRTGDFDGNGKADLIWRNISTNQTTLWLMNGVAPTAGFALSSDPNWFVQP